MSRSHRSAHPHRTRLAITGLASLLWVAPLTVHADTIGSATSSASSAGSASVGSLSDSVQGSSNSSAGDKKLAAGEYRVVATRAHGREIELQRVASPSGTGADAAPTALVSADTWLLRLPAQALADRPLQPGDHLWVQERAYGLAFSRLEPQPGEAATARAPSAPFYLALTDAWLKDIQARPVRL
jgi:hypothetical protein